MKKLFHPSYPLPGKETGVLVSSLRIESRVPLRRRGAAAASVLALTLASAAAIALPVSPVWAQEKPEQPPFPENEKKAPPLDDAPPVTPGRIDPSVLPERLTLSQAIEAALRLQPNVAAAQAGREASEQRLRQNEARYYPTVTPSYQYLNNYSFGTVNQFVGGTGGGGTVVPVQQGSTRETRNAVIGLNYRLWDSGTRDLNARQARQSLRAQTFAEENTRQTVIANVATNYFNSLRTAALVNVSEAQVARARNTLEVVRAQVEVGVSPRKDIFQAEADLLNAQVNLLQAQNNAEVAQAQLKNSIGVVGGERLTLADVPVPTPAIPVTAQVTVDASGNEVTEAAPRAIDVTTADPAAINLLAETAYRNRPDIAQSQQNVEASHTAVGLARINSGVVVTSDLSAGYQLDPEGFERSIGRNRQLTVGVSYPLFDAGLARANVNANRASARAGEAQLTSLRQQVAVEVEQNYRSLAQTRATIPAAEAAQRAAQINYEAATEAFREGAGSIVDVITAQTLLVQSQTSYVQAVYSFYGADAALARAVGQAHRIAESPVAQGSAGGAGAASSIIAPVTPLVTPPTPTPPTPPPTPNP